MKLKHLWKAAGLVALSAILILTLCLAGLLALVLAPPRSPSSGTPL